MKNVQKLIFILFILLFGTATGTAGFILGKNVEDEKEVKPSPTPIVTAIPTPSPTVTPTGSGSTDIILEYTFNNTEKNIVFKNPDNYTIDLSQDGKTYTLTYEGAKLIIEQTNTSYQTPGQGFTADESIKIKDKVYRTTWSTDDINNTYNISKEGSCGGIASPCFNFNFIDSATYGYFTATITLPTNVTSSEKTQIYFVFDSLISSYEIK